MLLDGLRVYDPVPMLMAWFFGLLILAVPMSASRGLVERQARQEKHAAARGARTALTPPGVDPNVAAPDRAHRDARLPDPTPAQVTSKYGTDAIHTCWCRIGGTLRSVGFEATGGCNRVGVLTVAGPVSRFSVIEAVDRFEVAELIARPNG